MWSFSDTLWSFFLLVCHQSLPKLQTLYVQDSMWLLKASQFLLRGYCGFCLFNWFGCFCCSYFFGMLQSSEWTETTWLWCRKKYESSSYFLLFIYTKCLVLAFSVFKIQSQHFSCNSTQFSFTIWNAPYMLIFLTILHGIYIFLLLRSIDFYNWIHYFSHCCTKYKAHSV